MSPNHLPPDSPAVWIFGGFACVLTVGLVDIATDGLLRRLARFACQKLAALGRVRLARSRRRLFGRREPADLAVITGTTAGLRQLVKDRNEELWAKLLGGDADSLTVSLQLYQAEHADYAPEVVAVVRGVPVFDLDFVYARRYAVDVRFLVAVRSLWHGHGPGPDSAEPAEPIVADLPQPERALRPAGALARVIDL